MDYSNDADPMISAAFISDLIPSSHHQLQNCMNPIEFEAFPRQALDGSLDLPLSLDSPVSVDAYSESDMELGFQDNHSEASAGDDEIREPPASISPPLRVDMSSSDSELLKADLRFVDSRFAPHDVFPVDNSWSLEEKARRLLQLSSCREYPLDRLMNIECLTTAEEKADMLIDIVARIQINFPWNYVEPHELTKSYTSVSKCKKDKKKDSSGKPAPKRPMNAFMIWSKKCRTLIAQFAPQLHNALISLKLGTIWRSFTDAEKAVYEREKERLQSFHAREFPDYKYRPQKKPNKKAEPKPTPAPATKPKSGSKKKRQADNNNASAHVRGLNVAVARSKTINPGVRDRLQVKIDSDFRKGIGKRSTAIDLAELTSYHKNELRSTTPPQTKVESLQNAVHFIIENQSQPSSSVFDTPGNSPHTPITPGSPSVESVCAPPSASLSRNDIVFTYDDKSFQMSLEQNNNNIGPTGFPCPNIKTEPQDLNIYQASFPSSDIKLEPDIKLEDVPADVKQPLPVLSVETVDDFFHNTNEETLTDIMSLLNTFPVDPSEGPATV